MSYHFELFSRIIIAITIAAVLSGDDADKFTELLLLGLLVQLLMMGMDIKRKDE